MNDKYFENWVIQTARTLDDISGVIKMVGIKFVDEDHLQLAEYLTEINRLILELEKNETSLILLKKQEGVLKKINEYAIAHFAREEKMIAKYGLTNGKEQKEQHSKILKELREILENLKSGNISVNSDLKSYLLEWLVNHINKYDYIGYKTENWKDQLISCKSLKDVEILFKKSGIEGIDLIT